MGNKGGRVKTTAPDIINPGDSSKIMSWVVVGGVSTASS